MEKIGDALMKLVESGAPLAAEAIRWWFIVKIVDTVMGHVALLIFLSLLFYVATKALRRWQDFTDARKEYWSKNSRY